MSGFDANDQLLRDLKTNSPGLQKLNEDFRELLDGKQLQVLNYNEGTGLKGVEGLT